MAKKPKSAALPEIEPHNELVAVIIQCPFDYDGDPDTEGAEHYEAGDILTVTRIVGNALVKADIAKLASAPPQKGK